MSKGSGKISDGLSILTSEYIEVYNLITGYDVHVFVEDDSDSDFWDDLLSEVKKNNGIRLITTSLWSMGIATGKGQLLSGRLKPSPFILICIDSDYDGYYTTESKLKEREERNFVFQTGAYSVENIFCMGTGIDQYIKRVSGKRVTVTPDYSVSEFLQELSPVIYLPFIYSLYCYHKNTSEDTATYHFGQKEFWRLIFPSLTKLTPSNLTRQTLLDNIQDKIQEQFPQIKARFPEKVQTRIENMTFYDCYGEEITSQNTFHYVNGHRLLWLILPLMIISLNSYITAHISKVLDDAPSQVKKLKNIRFLLNKIYGDKSGCMTLENYRKKLEKYHDSYISKIYTAGRNVSDAEREIVNGQMKSCDHEAVLNLSVPIYPENLESQPEAVRAAVEEYKDFRHLLLSQLLDRNTPINLTATANIISGLNRHFKEHEEIYEEAIAFRKKF